MQNTRSGKVVSGASTISMQIARMQGKTDESYYLEPRVGKHTLICVDDKGRSGSVEIEILGIQ